MSATSTSAKGLPTSQAAAHSDPHSCPSSKRRSRLATWDLLDRIVWVVRMIGFLIGGRAANSSRSPKPSATMGFAKSPRSPDSSCVSPKESNGRCSRWWSCQKVHAFQDERPPIATPHLAVEDETRKDPLAMCLDSVVLPPVPGEAPLESTKKPMLPLAALHRVVSPAARANAPELDFDAPQQLFLPTMGFSSASDEPGSSEPRPRKRTTANVSFSESAEWVYIDEEDPSSLPVMECQPLRHEDGGGGDRSPRSPRHSHLHDGVECSPPKSALADRFEADCAIDSTPRASKFNSFAFDGETVSAVPEAPLVLPISMIAEFCEADGDATPRHNPSVKLDFSFEDGASDEDDDERGNIESPEHASTLGDEFSRAAKDARTPKAQSSTVQFGLCSDSDTDNEDNMVTSETGSTFAPDVSDSPRASFGEDLGFQIRRAQADPCTPKAAFTCQRGSSFHNAAVDAATPKAGGSLPDHFGFGDSPTSTELEGDSTSEGNSPTTPSLGLFGRSPISSPRAVEAW